MEKIAIIIPFFLFSALLHSSVGFGGGSSYLALMALFLFPYELMPQIALICNIIVVTSGCYLFWKTGHLKIKDTLPFVIGSIPMSFIGGKIFIEKNLFLLLLAIILIIAGSNIFLVNTKIRHNLKEKYLDRINSSKREKNNFLHSFFFKLGIGSSLGFLSGLVGIGGGIFLAPLLYIINWAYAKKISATASFFILVNSLAGLCGHFSKRGIPDISESLIILPFAIAVFIGGQIGSRVGIFKLSTILTKRITAFIAIVAGLRIIAYVT